MKKRWKQLLAGSVVVLALMLGGWMLSKSVQAVQQSSAQQTQVEMHDALVVRP